MKLDLTTTPTKEDSKTISQGLVEANREVIGTDASPELAIEFSIFARDDDEQLIGGLRANYYWNALHIELVWVSKEFRNKGICTRLVKKAEAYATEQGGEKSLLGTTDWQAKALYEKLGYAIVASIPDYPKGHKMYYMLKELSKE